MSLNMAQDGISKPVNVSHTSLYDPIVGYIFAVDLFEKDLYREKIFENRREVNTGSHGRSPSVGTANP